MAAPSFSNAVRVRLHFDYPPPGTPGCRMCWLYIDLNKCRVVTDLASIIRDKFDFSRRTALDLFIEDCFLPPNESIYVIRDNDSIRVKAEGFLPALNGTEPSEPSPCKGQKRRRSVEDVPSERDHTKKSKKKKSSRETPNLTAQPEEGEHRAEKKRKTREESTEEEHSRRKKTGQKEKTSAADTGSRDGKKPSSSSVKSSAAPSSKLAAAAGKKPSGNRPAPASSHSSSTDSDSSEDQPASKKEQSKTPQSARVQPKPATASGGGSAKRAPVPSKPVITNASVPSKPVTARAASSLHSSSTDSDSSEDQPASKKEQSKTPQSARVQPKPATASGGGSAKRAPVPSKPVITNASVPSKPVTDRAASSSESSSEADSSEQREVAKAGLVSSASLPAKETPAPAVERSSAPAQAETPSSDSSSEDEFVIKKPQTVSGLNRAVTGNGRGRETPLGVGRGSPLGEGRGLGRGDGRFPWRGSVGRGLRGGRARGATGQCFSYDYNGSQQQQKKQHFAEKASNTSVMLQYPAEAASKKDYCSCPLLTAPSQIGQKIAFKLLELTENYTPEVSEYKEGKIIHYIPHTNQVELEILSCDAVCKEPGKFDLVYHTPDGAREIEYAVSRGSKRVTERWDSLIEPRLIIEPASLPAAGETG
ncbi:coilin-like [Acipenser ruthenus]|uniref:coilin-like n=1 Tax=Acipenser ruthenus TaxID=7906 RepID=UPI002740F131|nr:coilin-like [Acipenser ruthenus]